MHCKCKGDFDEEFFLGVIHHRIAVEIPLETVISDDLQVDDFSSFE
jgi:hypothetical protein